MNAVARREESHRLRVQADAVAGALPPLLVSTRNVAASVTLGVHGRRRAGVGDTFWQFRQYGAGDTPQGIDWRQSGKRDVVFVREREWIAAQTAALWCDMSPSMHYSSTSKLSPKSERAAVMTLALAELLADGGERIIHLTGDGQDRRAASGRMAVGQIADIIAGEIVTPPTAHVAAFPKFSARLPRHATAVLISDFLAPIEEIATSINDLIRRGLAGHLVQVLDPAEETLPFAGRVRFVGMEREGATIIERAEDARVHYSAKLAAHREALKAMTAKAGWSFHVHHTDRSPQMTMAALHNAITGYRR
jgi:uncharacterized protein (DUF58 family)